VQGGECEKLNASRDITWSGSTVTRATRDSDASGCKACQRTTTGEFAFPCWKLRIRDVEQPQTCAFPDLRNWNRIDFLSRPSRYTLCNLAF
jgi:hypothetical protein